MTAFKCIVADPAWSFGDKLPGKSRGAEKNYKVMTIDDICGMRLRESGTIRMCGRSYIMASDALLFLWRVSSQVEEAYRVVRAWGFVPKSEIVWVKTTQKKSPSANGSNGAAEPYGGHPPSVSTDTSEAAADSVAEDAERLRALVLDSVAKWGKRGRTCDEIERGLQMIHQTASARVRELTMKGLIIDGGDRRRTRSNRWAIVWVKAPPGTPPSIEPARRSLLMPKLHFGMGHYVRASHETCIIAARGKAIPLIKNRSTRSVFFAPTGEHSEKPEAFFKLIEDLCEGPRLELFARRQRANWTCVGDEM